ncbi:hypothetical protein [Brucella intermedia]|nr:hypothetical protein [Brucella intermedia]
MGEAKRKKSGQQIVFHHTSILRTNLIWMSGKIELEGQGRPAFHPHMGKHISQSVEARRPCREFPPLAWFTSRIDVPHCLRKITFCGENQETGEVTNIVLSDREASAISLRRMALGFRVEDIGVIRWTDHYGYCTAEGRDLNESAIEYGDNPEDWWVSETPVDVALVHEAWVATSSWGVKMQRMPGYEKDIRRMVALCKERRTYIPPAWLSRDDAQALAQSIGLPCVDADEEADRFLQSH